MENMNHDKQQEYDELYVFNKFVKVGRLPVSDKSAGNIITGLTALKKR
jgi:hypothetical protein